MHEFIAKAQRLHAGIAADVFPHGATLTCVACGREEAATTADCGRYLARGWPTCCGATMALSPRPTTPEGES